MKRLFPAIAPSPTDKIAFGLMSVSAFVAIGTLAAQLAFALR